MNARAAAGRQRADEREQHDQEKPAGLFETEIHKYHRLPNGRSRSFATALDLAGAERSLAQGLFPPGPERTLAANTAGI